jgi:hypothetical protein
VSTGPDPSAAAEQARARLHEEIERVRRGVEEMLAEQGGGDPDLRRELDLIRAETRGYVKKRIRKTEKRLDKRIDALNSRTRDLEQRLEQSEQDRKYSEWRIHTNTEQMLDGLLREIRAIGDLLSRTK